MAEAAQEEIRVVPFESKWQDNVTQIFDDGLRKQGDSMTLLTLQNWKVEKELKVRRQGGHASGQVEAAPLSTRERRCVDEKCWHAWMCVLVWNWTMSYSKQLETEITLSDTH